MTTLDITIDTQVFDNLAGRDAPLFEQWHGQEFRARLLLEEDGTCTLDTHAPWENACPAAEWYGCTQIWALPASVRGDALHCLLTDEQTIELLQRVHNGRSVEWNGNNYMGTLDEDATEAYDELENQFEALGDDSFGPNLGTCWAVWPTDAWLGDCTLGELWPAGRSLSKAAIALLEQARDEGILCGDADDIESALLDRLQRKLDDDDDFEPTAEQRTALEA